MQCGIDRKRSLVSFYSFMCHRLLLPLLLQGTTAPVHMSQVFLDKSRISLQSHPGCPSSRPPFTQVTIVQLMDFSVCSTTASNIPFMLDVYEALPRFILGAMLLILAVTQTLKQSVNMYKATKRWQPNRYMQRLAKDGIIYFLVYVSASPPLVSTHHHRVLLSILSPNVCRRTDHLNS